jgi:hypothetical protein
VVLGDIDGSLLIGVGALVSAYSMLPNRGRSPVPLIPFIGSEFQHFNPRITCCSLAVVPLPWRIELDHPCDCNAGGNKCQSSCLSNAPHDDSTILYFGSRGAFFFLLRLISDQFISTCNVILERSKTLPRILSACLILVDGTQPQGAQLRLSLANILDIQR